MLHIHNGGSTAGTLREFGFPGEHKAFQEVLMEGPAPGWVSRDEWLQVRAGFLTGTYDLELDKCKDDLREQEAWLRGFSIHEEAILWFEHDLFCQINLIYLLDWFSQQSLGRTRLSLVCVDAFPGVEDFRGLGQLTGEQLASLFDTRHEVTDAELQLAARAWKAYCSADPREITRLVKDDTSAMPFLRRAFSLHLERFPSAKNGLGRIENTALEMISTGPIRFNQLFPAFAKSESAYGLGDSQFWFALQRLGNANDPLINISVPDESALKPDSYHDASFGLTETGIAVLAGERDFIEINGIDLWLGGTHLIDDMWRWDARDGLTGRSHK